MILEHKGTSIFYQDSGKGPVILLLHGFLENVTMWKDVSAELQKTHRILSIDLLGHGKTGCLGYIHTMDAMADAVLAVLHHLKIDRFSIVGHSMGGYVALSIAEKHSNKIDGLCLMNSTAQEDSEERKAIRTRANKMAQENFTSMVKMSVFNLFYQENLKRLTEEVSLVKKEALKTSLQGYLACQEGMKIRPNREDIVQSKKFKTLYILGENDPILDVNLIKKEAEKSNSEIVVFNGGHMVHLENKAALNKVLLDFTSKTNQQIQL